MTSPRSILIVGGGTAGWLTACYLARTLGTSLPGGVVITLIESPEIGIIGVGEGTFPTIKATLQLLGIDEAHFLRETTGTFKQGIRFADWVKTPVNGRHDHYFHPFENPYGVNGAVLPTYWLLQDEATRAPLASTITFQQRVAESQRAPKQINDANYKGALQYAYHFDALKFAKLLAEHGAKLGVRHLKGNISDVHLDDSGAIDRVTSREHGDLSADLYIDCTGQRAELIGKAMSVPYKSVNDVLFTDRAVTCQVPYDSPDAPIESYTVSTAHAAGWTWDIGLNSRRGIGYVYSSRHASDEEAEATLRAYVGGTKGKDVSTRIVKFDAGYRETQWKKNCVAVGLSAGFFEPLESTGIVLIEVAATMLAEFFAFEGPVDASAARFNHLMKLRCENITNFIKLHYCLSRRDEPFWRDNADARSIPASLQYMLDTWKFRPPNRFDFLLELESFSVHSYQYILYGMGFKTDFEASRSVYPRTDSAEQLFEHIKGLGERALKELPAHRSLIEQIYHSGFAEKTNGLLSMPAKA